MNYGVWQLPFVGSLGCDIYVKIRWQAIVGYKIVHTSSKCLVNDFVS